MEVNWGLGLGLAMLTPQVHDDDTYVVEHREGRSCMVPVGNQPSIVSYGDLSECHMTTFREATLEHQGQDTYEGSPLSCSRVSVWSFFRRVVSPSFTFAAIRLSSSGSIWVIWSDASLMFF